MDWPPIIYRVDAADRITSVNNAWDAFATANDGAAILSERVVGRHLFDFIGDASTRQLFLQMLTRIRSGKSLRYSYRCDSPNCRRLMEMQIHRIDSVGAVEFQSVTLEAVSREPLHLPQADGADAAEPAKLQRVCGWCNRLDVDGRWMEIEDAVPRLRLMEQSAAPMLTHGMCEDCVARMMTELEMAASA